MINVLAAILLAPAQIGPTPILGAGPPVAVVAEPGDPDAILATVSASGTQISVLFLRTGSDRFAKVYLVRDAAKKAAARPILLWGDGPGIGGRWATVPRESVDDILAHLSAYRVDVRTEGQTATTTLGRLRLPKPAGADGCPEWTPRAVTGPGCAVAAIGALPIGAPGMGAPGMSAPGFGKPGIGAPTADVPSVPAARGPFGQAAVPPEAEPEPEATEPQTVTFEEPPAPYYGDRDVALRASSSSGLAVWFTATGDCSIDGSAMRIVQAGACWVTAHQGGDSRFAAAPEVDQRILIAKAGQRLTFDEVPDQIYLNANIPLHAKATSGLTATFGAVGDCSIGMGSSVHLEGTGECWVTAHQVGDRNFTAAPILERHFSIAKARQTISFVSESSPLDGLVLKIGAKSTSGLPVELRAGAPCTMYGGLVIVPAGLGCTVSAYQPGDGNFHPAILTEWFGVPPPY